MTQANQAAVAGTPAVEAAVAAAPVVKAPSKKSQADAIFAAKLVERSQGLFATNKDFRAAVLTKIQADLGVSVASAATMYNACKVASEAADAGIGLGRDPKKEKAPKGSGKPGRPAGSKNAVKTDETAPAADAAATTEAPASTEPAADPVA